MSTLRDKAVAVADALVTTHGMSAEDVKASPFIDFLMGLFKQLLPMLLTCLPVAATPAQVLAEMQKLGAFQRWQLRRAVRRHIGDPGMEDVLLGPLVAEIRNVARASTEADVQAAMDEVG